MYSLESSHESEEGYLIISVALLICCSAINANNFFTDVKMKMYRWKFVIFYSYFCAKRVVRPVRSNIHWHTYTTNNLYNCKMSILCEICNLCFITAQNINCGYSLELPHWGSSNRNSLTWHSIKAANGDITMHVHCRFFSIYWKRNGPISKTKLLPLPVGEQKSTSLPFIYCSITMHKLSISILYCFFKIHDSLCNWPGQAGTKCCKISSRIQEVIVTSTRWYQLPV